MHMKKMFMNLTVCCVGHFPLSVFLLQLNEQKIFPFFNLILHEELS